MRKHEKKITSGPFEGLWRRAANCLRVLGYESRDSVIDAIRNNEIEPGATYGYGVKCHEEVLKWAGFDADLDRCVRYLESMGYIVIPPAE